MKNNKHRTVPFFCCILAFFASTVFSPAQEETLIGGSNANLREYILDALAAGQKKISMPGGIYKLKAAQRQHIALKNLEDVEIDFGGAELRCLDKTRALTLENCRNVKIKNLVIDYESLPFTQGKIVHISDNKLEHTIEIFDGYPRAEFATAEKYEIFNPETRMLRCSTYFNCRIEKLPGNSVRIIKPGSAKNLRDQTEQVGDLVVMATLRGNAIPHAVMLSKSNSCTLENITVYSANSFSFYEAGCDSSTYKNCALLRRPAQTDHAVRADPRLRSGNADAFHSKFARTGPSYLDCRSEFNGDDSVAINGSYHGVRDWNGKVLRVFTKSGDMDMEAGDEVEILIKSGAVRMAKVSSVKRIGQASQEDIEAFKTQRIWEHVMKNGAFRTEYEIELEKEAEIEEFSMIASRNKMGAGFKIIGGHYGKNRSRGLIIKSSNGVIKNVRIEAAWMAAILMAPEWFWLEAGHSHNVLIEGNEILAGVTPGIDIHSKNAGGRGYLPAGAHSKITIRNNTISYFHEPAVFITSVDGLNLSGNTFEKLPKPFYEVTQARREDLVKLINVEENKDPRGKPRGI